MTCFVSFVSFDSFRGVRRVFVSFRRSLFPGSLRGAFSGGRCFFRRGLLGLTWRALSGVRRAFPEWPCFGGSEGPTFSGTPFSGGESRGAGLRNLSLSGPLSGVRRPHFPLPQLENPQLIWLHMWRPCDSSLKTVKKVRTHICVMSCQKKWPST